MDTITLTNQGRPVARATPTRVWLAAHIQALPDGHPRKRLVCFMALFAREILTGTLPGCPASRNATCWRVGSVVLAG